MRTRSALARTLNVTVLWGRVNLNAFCSEIPDHRRKDLLIGFNRQFLLHRGHNQLEAAGVRLQYGGSADLVNEFGNDGSVSCS